MRKGHAYGWRERALRQLDALDQRIAALDGRFYYGCGFHYGKHEQATKLRQQLTAAPPADPKLASVNQLVHEVVLEGLTKDVADAERSADAYAAGAD